MRTDKGDYHIAGPCGCEGSAQLVKATSGQNSVQKLAHRPPPVVLRAQCQTMGPNSVYRQIMKITVYITVDLRFDTMPLSRAPLDHTL